MEHSKLTVEQAYHSAIKCLDTVLQSQFELGLPHHLKNVMYADKMILEKTLRDLGSYYVMETATEKDEEKF